MNAAHPFGSEVGLIRLDLTDQGFLKSFLVSANSLAKHALPMIDCVAITAQQYRCLTGCHIRTKTLNYFLTW